MTDILKDHNLQVDDSLVTEIITAVSSSNPVSIEKGGPLSTSYQRKQYFDKKKQILTYLIQKRNTC